GRARRPEGVRRVEERQQLASELLPPEREQLDHDDLRPELPKRLQDHRSPHVLGPGNGAATVAADEPSLGVEAERREGDEGDAPGTDNATRGGSAVQEDHPEAFGESTGEYEPA